MYELEAGWGEVHISPAKTLHFTRIIALSGILPGFFCVSCIKFTTMRKLLVTFLLMPFLASAQEKTATGFSGASFLVGISFHAVSTPLHKPGNNFRNLGFKVGAELPWNQKDNLRQSVELGYYFNRFNGRSIYAHSDFVYRPRIAKDLRADFRLGPGLGYVLHPGDTWKQKDGEWVTDRSGKLFVQVHGAFGLSYNNIRIKDVDASPFVQYEVMAITGYNRGITILPTSIIHLGSRFKF